MLARTHTVAAAALIAAVPLGPLGMWTYARLASPDRGAEQRHAESILATLPPPEGARRSFVQWLTFREWGGESLVPVREYRFDYAERLPRRVRAGVVVAYYTRALPDWRRTIERDSCHMLSLPMGCAAQTVSFHRPGATLVLDLAEYLEHDGHSVVEYGVNVSQ